MVCTLRPAGPVWRVTSVLPSILAATSFAPAFVLQNLTPPLNPSVNAPLPRPPAWICDFTMVGPSGSPASALMNSSGVLAAAPLGTGTPNFSNRALAWYSWTFIDSLLQCRRTDPGKATLKRPAGHPSRSRRKPQPPPELRLVGPRLEQPARVRKERGDARILQDRSGDHDIGARREGAQPGAHVHGRAEVVEAVVLADGEARAHVDGALEGERRRALGRIGQRVLGPSHRPEGGGGIREHGHDGVAHRLDDPASRLGRRRPDGVEMTEDSAERGGVAYLPVELGGVLQVGEDDRDRTHRYP